MKKLFLINIILIGIFFIIPTVGVTQLQYKLCEYQGIIKNSISPQTEYIPDLRNTDISFDMNLLTKSNLTSSEYEKMFANTSMSGLGKAFEQAEQETGVNGIYLAGLGCLESSWGRSGFAQTRNNLFGYQSYDTNLDATKRFDTKEQGVVFVASKIKSNYLTQSGAYHSGYTIQSVSNRYATDKRTCN